MAIDTLGANALASNSVTTAKIVNDAVTAAKIPAGAVVADIADGGITTAKLADDAITGAKLANDIAISTTGNIATTSSGTITSAGLITASGGVAVGGTGAANTFDDYEEGDWTPDLKVGGSLVSGIGYNYREGRYRKVAGVCHVHFRLEINAKGSTSSGSMTITDLPFAIVQNYPIGVIGCQNASSAHTNFPNQTDCQGLWALGAGTTVYLRYNSTTGYGDWNYSYVPSAGTNIWGSMSFNVT